MAHQLADWKGPIRPLEEVEETLPGSSSYSRKAALTYHQTLRARNHLSRSRRGSSMEDLLRPRLRPMLETRRSLPALQESGGLRGMRSSSVVIYRSAKYDGVLGRWKVYLKTYFQVMLVQAMPVMHGCHDYLLQVLGALYLALMWPVHLLVALGLLFLRKGRFYLVRRADPKAVVCEDLSPRCIFIGKSLGMVTCILWLRGRLDINHLRTTLLNKCNEIPILLQKLEDKFGLRAFTQPDVPFSINEHVVEAPRELLKHFVSEDRLYSGKSALEQFVTKCASEHLNPGISPWKITMIPLPVFKKERSVVVLRLHHVLLNFPQVRQQLCEGIFTQSIYEDGDVGGGDTGLHSYFCNDSFHDSGCSSEDGFDVEGDDGPAEIPSSLDSAMHVSFQQPIENVKEYVQKMPVSVVTWFKQNLYISVTDIQSWTNLRLKQLQFHSKAVVLKTILVESLLSVRSLVVRASTAASQAYYWTELKSILLQLLLILRAAAFVPVEIYSLLLCPSPKRSGFRRADSSSTRRVAWSSPISSELIKVIKEHTGMTTESIMLTACSLALKDYYSETGLQNPSHVGVLVPLATSDLLAPSGYTTLDISTDNITIHQELQKVNHSLRNTPPRVLLARYFILKYMSYLVPRPVAYLVMQRLFRRYPVTFTKVNLQSPSSMHLPHMSLWDKTVDEFFLFKPPYSDFCVSISLICYAETMRLSVICPMKSLDTALVQKFTQHLNRIAEEVGVDRSLIPYSRRSSPSSSYCSSPSSIRSQDTLLRSNKDD